MKNAMLILHLIGMDSNLVYKPALELNDRYPEPFCSHFDLLLKVKRRIVLFVCGGDGVCM